MKKVIFDTTSKITNKVPNYKSLQGKKNLIAMKFFVGKPSNCCNKPLLQQKKFVAHCYDKVCDNRLLQKKLHCNRVLFQ